MLVSDSLGPSQKCLLPWCSNITPLTFIEGLYRKEPHEAHFCICCEIGIRTLSIKLFSVPYLRLTWGLALSLVPGKKMCLLWESSKFSSFLLVSSVIHCVSLFSFFFVLADKTTQPVSMYNCTHWVSLYGWHVCFFLFS